MTLADLVSELVAQMPLQVRRSDSMAMLRQAGVAVRVDRGGAARVAPPARLATQSARLRPATIKRSA